MPLKDNYDTFMGHETWWNEFRMTLKMYKNICIILLTVDFFLVGMLLDLDKNKSFTLFTIAKNSFEATVKWFGSEVSNEFVVNYLKLQAQNLIAEMWMYIFLLIMIPLIMFPLIMKYFSKRAKTQEEDDFVRGARLCSPQEINRNMKKRKEHVRFKLGDLAITKEIENLHTCIVGSPGSGKTHSYFAPLVSNLMQQQCKGIINCTKGDFTSRFLHYESGKYQNLIFNPLDDRTLKWTVFNDLEDVTDIERIAYRLIPIRYDLKDPSWDNGARQILIGLLHFAYKNRKTKNSDFYEIFTSTISDKKGMLSDTDYGRPGLSHYANPTSKQAQSYDSVLNLYINAFQYMQDGSFSIRKWLDSENKKGFIFLLNNPKFEDTLRPALSLFMELFASHLLSMKDDESRRVFFILDEFTSLTNQSSLVQIIKLARSKGAAVSIGVQEFGQLDKIYGPEDRRTILGSCNNIIAMRTRDVDTAKYLSELFGEIEEETCRKNISTGVHDFKDGISIERTREKRQLVLPSEFQQLSDYYTYALLTNYGICKTDLVTKRLYLKEKESKSVKIVPRFVVRKGLSLEEISNSQHLLEHNAKKAEVLGESNSGRDNEKQTYYDREGGIRMNTQQSLEAAW